MRRPRLALLCLLASWPLGCGSDDEAEGTPVADASVEGSAAEPDADAAPEAAPPAVLACAPCPPPALPAGLEPLLGAVQLSDCCIDDTTCGVDLDAVAGMISSLLGAGAPPPPLGCQDPAALTALLGDGAPLPIPDGGVDIGDLIGTPVRVLDGGIVEYPDGSAPFVLDDSCASISVSLVIAQVQLPGCCRPDGTCGASTHELAGSGGALPAPLTCAGSEELQAMLDAQSPAPGLVTVTPTPSASCTYPLGGSSTRDASVDASADGPPPAEDASVAPSDASRSD